MKCATKDVLDWPQPQGRQHRQPQWPTWLIQVSGVRTRTGKKPQACRKPPGLSDPRAKATKVGLSHLQRC